MAKRLTVFYAWQSDTPSKLNRNFIENALIAALARLRSDATVDPALRDASVELDKDTKGVAGSPPIADTILRKVEECAVFVADLTFVGESKSEIVNSDGKPRQFPNPNVLIEYGYALRCHSHRKLVSIMNTAYGTPEAESLPFDLRHLRRPITYSLSDSSGDDKQRQFEKLVGVLVEAIGSVLSEHSSSQDSVEKFIPRKSTTNPAVFYDDAKDLLLEDSYASDKLLTVLEGGKIYLRLCPTVSVPPIETELEAVKIAAAGELEPMGRVVSGWAIRRNIFGAIVFESPFGGHLRNFTQLFLSREIWAVDARVLNAEEQRKILEGIVSPIYIPSGYLENYLGRALHRYLMFAKQTLKLPPPLRVEMGLVGIQGCMMAVDNSLAGKAMHKNVQWDGEVNYENPAPNILAPFLKKVWANCALERTDERQAEFVRRFNTGS